MTTSRTSSKETYVHPGLLYAVRELRIMHAQRPELSLREAADARRSVDSTTRAFDFEGALAVVERDSAVLSSLETELHLVARDVLASVVAHERPSWASLIPQGRRALKGATVEREANVHQCFEYALLFDDEASVHNWWDMVEHEVRDQRQLAKEASGKEAELLSMKHERDRLASIGLAHLMPKHESREDTRLGYDIESWDLFGGESQRIYIEVKGSSANPLSFFISPNEWKVGKARRDNFRIHLWNLKVPDKPIVITPDELEPHIPEDRGSGQWRSAEIQWRRS